MSLAVEDTDNDVCPGILNITLKSDKMLKYAKVEVSTPTGVVLYREERTLHSPRIIFRAPRDLSLTAHLTLRIKYSQSVIIKKSIYVTGADILTAYKRSGETKQAWKKSYGNIDLVVEIEHPLRPTSERIFEICPRFRVLLIGQVGIGKSTLISKLFGAMDIRDVSAQLGRSDIDQEFLSGINSLLVTHTNLGFETEDIEHLIVQQFIERRGQETEIKKRVHAVWFCIQTPASGDLILQPGVKSFLQLKVAGKLGDVPLIVVFTKSDRIVTMERLNLTKAGVPATLEEATKNANLKLKKNFFTPFENAVNNAIPYIAVSTRPRYMNTLSTLIEMTFEHVARYNMEAAIVAGISQRINPQVKTRASIEVGKQKYWSITTSGMKLGVLREIMDVIHQDIVRVWDMEDNNNLLCSTEFKTLILNSIESSRAFDVNKMPAGAVPMNKVTSVILDALSGPATSSTISIASPGWGQADEFRHDTSMNLQRAMMYIVNLTIIMQNLFWIQSILATRPPGDDSRVSHRVTVPIKRRFIKLAYTLYIGASDHTNILRQIDAYTNQAVPPLPVPSQDKRSTPTDKVTEMIHAHTISSQEAFAQRIGIAIDGSWENREDEEWDLRYRLQ